MRLLSTGRGVVPWIPAADRVLVPLVHQQSLLLTGPVEPGLDQDQAPAGLVAVHVRVQFARCDGGRRIVDAVRLPGTAVPDTATDRTQAMSRAATTPCLASPRKAHTADLCSLLIHFVLSDEAHNG